jgi:Fic family protein
LAIENNSLSLDQVTAIINGKRVLGPPDEIREVQNAYEAYNRLPEFDPYAVADLLTAHRLLMTDLTREAGRFRSGGVGVFAGERLVHMAPPAARVPQLVADLMAWVKGSEAHPLITSCVFHYEFEFIHPFADGNGRMGRMWQNRLLYQWKPMFAWLPVETLIRERQQAYYDALKSADKATDAGVFVEFILQAIADALLELAQTAQVRAQVTAQVERLLEALDSGELSTAELMGQLGLKHRQSFRSLYLLPALELGLVKMTIPDKPNSSRQKYSKKV